MLHRCRWGLAALIGVLTLAGARAGEFEGREFVLGGAPSGGRGPLVIALHGMGGSGPHLRDSANFGDIAPGVTIAYPTAPGGVWNDGRFAFIDRPAAQRRAGRDDVTWLIGLARHLGHERFYLIGHSNGGGMAVRMACDAPDHVLGLANVAAKMFIDFECRSTAPVSVVLFYGTDDRVSPHSGRPTGMEGVFNVDVGRGHDAETSVGYWQERKRCAGAATEWADPDPQDGVHLRIHRYQDCAASLVYYEMVGAGHGLPGGDPVKGSRLRRVIGEPIRDVSVADAVAGIWFPPVTR